MRISRLELHNFRNYEELALTPGDSFNLLLGRNAQGKTSLLEAIYVLATSRSWRAGRDSELIKWGAERARLSTAVEREEQNDVAIEVLIGRSEKKQVMVNTIRQTRLAGLMGQVNVVLIEASDAEIVRGEPSERRKFLNLEISQVQPQYCHLLLGYRKVLEQRNRVLRDLQTRHHSDRVLDVLDEQLVNYGSRIVERRLQFVEQVARLARVIHSQITDGGEACEIGYVSSVELSEAETAAHIAERLRERLEELRDEEIRRGVTLIGPQRDDLLFEVNGADARTYGSHGQQRTVALSLRLAEMELMEETAKEPPVILLDDVMTGLEEERRAHVLQTVRGRCQTFMTATSRKLFDPGVLDDSRIFSVSQGRVTAE